MGKEGWERAKGNKIGLYAYTYVHIICVLNFICIYVCLYVYRQIER